LKLQLPKIYPITTAAVAATHIEQVERMIRGGATLIQIRDKDAGMKSLLQTVRDAVAAAKPAGARIIVNDRVDVAMLAGAHGVHLGQDDLPPKEARKILGPNAIIGLSTHSVEQAVAALDEPIDYLAIGPVYQTATKTDTDPIVGLEGVAAVRNVIGDLPLVAIGGIGLNNSRDVIDAGAISVAVISGLHRDDRSIPELTAAYLAKLS
jgi:thiamine-phosphate pyrophosphorylase